MFNPIEFPGLGWGPFDPNPVAFNILNRDITWYGIIIAVGFLLASFYATWRAPQAGIKAESFSDALFFCVPVAIICARLYYVLFDLSSFASNPIRILYIWEGGVAIYGAVIGATITAVVFARVKKLSPLALLDVGVLGILIGQCIGRWGNFINREAFGRQTELPWRMEIFSWADKGIVQVHPTFFYESMWTLCGFVLLHILFSRRKYDGQILLGYVAWYGFGRGIIEGLRTDSLYWGDFRVSQVLAFVSCAIAVLLLLYFHFKPPHKPLYVTVVNSPAEEATSDTTTDETPSAGVELADDERRWRRKDENDS